MLETLRNLLERLSSEAYNPWVIVVELLLIGVSVNWCASVLQGTRGTRLLRGLVIVLLVVTLVMRIIAAQTDWTRLELLYGYFIVGLALIALVAFQPELRRALIRAGEVSLLRRAAPESPVIAALVESAKYLSRNRYGALIAIQRDVGLRNWAEHGVMLNAEVSAELLNTIFFPNSALHDLGVIIEGRTVLAASCQFPQAESGETDASLGSRHRAAIGLSQESDALVLVVSEETGAISLADGGRLLRFLSLDDLKQELETRLSGRTQGRTMRPTSWHDLLRVGRRLAAVAPLTLVIWFLAEQASLIDVDQIDVQLNVQSEAGLVVDRASPTVFTCSFRGPAGAIDRLKADARRGPIQLDWKLDDPYTQPGAYHPGAADLIARLPEVSRRGLALLRVSPSTFTFSVDEVVSESMPVRLDHGGVVVGDVQIEPARVQVAMRRRAFERLPEAQRVATARVVDLLARAAPDQTYTFEAVPLSAQIGGEEAMRVQPAQVAVTVRVLGQKARRQLSGVRVMVEAGIELQQRYLVLPADTNEWLISIEVEGNRAALDALGPQDVRAFVPIDSGLARSAGAASLVADVEFILPPGIELVSRPPQVQFRLVPREDGAP